ncbi:MAG TPA: DUF6088 family protein [Pirellulales bacterium]|nr:DUF6088 family protein [Pirellulales bacterium]
MTLPSTGLPGRGLSVALLVECTISRKSIRCSDFSRRPPRRWRALAGRDRTRLQPAGAYAANSLGLSEQVPAKAVFLTDGPSRTVKVGPTTIQLRRTTPKNMEAAGRLSGLLIQALRELGQEHVTRERRDHLKRTLPANERRELLKDLRLAPAWMHPIFRELAVEKV